MGFKLSKKLKLIYGDIDLIYSANTLTHISNLNTVFKSINNILSTNGVLIIEDPSLLECIKKIHMISFIMNIYIFFNNSSKEIIKKFKLEIFDVKTIINTVVH